MNRFVILLTALFSLNVRAETIEFAAFTGYERCTRTSQVPSGVICFTYLDFASIPNNEIELMRSGDETCSEGKLDRDDSQNGFRISTSIQVRKNLAGYVVTLKSLGLGEAELVPETTVDFDRIENLSATKRYGPTFADPQYYKEVYYKPFIYISQPWHPEPFPRTN